MSKLELCQGKALLDVHIKSFDYGADGNNMGCNRLEYNGLGGSGMWMGSAEIRLSIYRFFTWKSKNSKSEFHNTDGVAMIPILPTAIQYDKLILWGRYKYNHNATSNFARSAIIAKEFTRLIHSNGLTCIISLSSSSIFRQTNERMNRLILEDDNGYSLLA